MLACLCNNCHLFCCSQVTPNFAWCFLMACLLNDTFTNKIDHFTDNDGDKKTKFESFFTKILSQKFDCPFFTSHSKLYPNDNLI